MNPLKITASADAIVTSGTNISNLLIKKIALCAAAATATVEIFDGTQAGGVSIAKLSAVSGTSANDQDFNPPLVAKSGKISVTITGAGAQAYLYQ